MCQNLIDKALENGDFSDLVDKSAGDWPNDQVRFRCALGDWPNDSAVQLGALASGGLAE